MYGQLPTTGFTGAVYAIAGFCLTIAAGLAALLTRLVRAH